MKRMVIKAAENEEVKSMTLEDILGEKISDASDKFDYIIDGLDQIDPQEAQSVLDNLIETFQGVMEIIAGDIVG